MKKLFIPTVLFSILTVILISSYVFPAMAESSEGKKPYKHWSIPIGNATGSLEITQTTDKSEIKNKILPLDQVVEGYSDIHRANIGVALNNDGKYYLVWKLTSFSYDLETDAKTKTIHVLDAQTGTPLTEPITKEGSGHYGFCANKDKSQTSKTSGSQV